MKVYSIGQNFFELRKVYRKLCHTFPLAGNSIYALGLLGYGNVCYSTGMPLTLYIIGFACTINGGGVVDIATTHQLSANVSVSREVINVFSCTNTSMVEHDLTSMMMASALLTVCNHGYTKMVMATKNNCIHNSL